MKPKNRSDKNTENTLVNLRYTRKALRVALSIMEQIEAATEKHFEGPAYQSAIRT
jgi:hypothetical protein